MRCNGCGMEFTDARGVCPYCGSVNQSGFEEQKSVKRSFELDSVVDARADGVGVFDKCIHGILEISTEISRGSGFLISSDGYALTNTHVVVNDKNKPCCNVSAILNNIKVRAEIIELGDEKGGWGRGIDLAIIKLSKVPAGATPLQFEDSSNVRNGETVFAIGNSKGEGTCITRGIVSDCNRKLYSEHYIMNDCAINPGNSGGPLLNENGKVIGINTCGRKDATGMEYAIPSNAAVEFAKKYL